MAAQPRRDQLLDGTVDFLLDNGLGALSLRPLAAALGTSDRMLIYYFGTREALLRAALEAVAGRLRGLLAAVMPPRRQTPAELLTLALTAADDPHARRLLAMWVDVVALAARGDAVCAETARTVLGDWVGWLAEHLDVPAAQAGPAAAGILAIIDGLVLLRASGADEHAESAASWLVAALQLDPRPRG